MPKFPAYEIYKEYEDPDKYKTSEKKKVEKVLKEAASAKASAAEAGIERIDLEIAKEIMGEKDFLGPEAIEATWGFKPEEIPEIPFSKEELERAKELGQRLILRIDKTEQGLPLTMEKMNKLLQNKTKDKGKILRDTDWYKNEDFYKKEPPKAGWVLSSKEIIPNSTDKNYIQQTETIIDYLQNQVFKDQPLPQEYESAIREFQQKKADLQDLLTKDWKKAAEILENLQITKLTRPSPSELLYDLSVSLQTNQERHLQDKYAWTNRRSSGGSLVDAGYFDRDGAYVGSWRPDDADGDLGVSFSRSL